LSRAAVTRTHPDVIRLCLDIDVDVVAARRDGANDAVDTGVFMPLILNLVVQISHDGALLASNADFILRLQCPTTPQNISQSGSA